MLEGNIYIGIYLLCRTDSISLQKIELCIKTIYTLIPMK